MDLTVTYPPPVVPASALPQLLRQPWIPHPDAPETLVVTYRGRQVAMVVIDIFAELHPTAVEGLARHVAELHARWLAEQEMDDG